MTVGPSPCRAREDATQRATWSWALSWWVLMGACGWRGFTPTFPWFSYCQSCTRAGEGVEDQVGAGSAGTG